jgi:hypothetical protein
MKKISNVIKVVTVRPLDLNSTVISFIIEAIISVDNEDVKCSFQVFKDKFLLISPLSEGLNQKLKTEFKKEHRTIYRYCRERKRYDNPNAYRKKH